MADLLTMNDKKNPDKQKALDSALAQIERQFGKGSIMKLGDGARQEIEASSTGSLGLDIALGIGGLPMGRIVEIYGPESSGKTTLTLHCIAEQQKRGGVCAFVDAEHALDPQYARKLGVDLDELLISQPDTGEQALEITDTLVRSGAVNMVVVDSVAALTPKSELEGDMASARTVFHFYTNVNSEPTLRVMGIYHDQFVREGDSWKLKQRELQGAAADLPVES